MTNTEEFGKCALCHETRELRLSHYLPKFLYRLSTGYVNGQARAPIVMSDKGANYASHQVRAYLLCEGCEQRVSNGGELWCSKYFGADLVSFPLSDFLMTCPPLLSDGDNKTRIVWGINSTRLRVKNLLYFCASIFWRGCVHTWHDQRGVKPDSIILPAKIQEELRLFLLGRAPFPQSAAMMTVVNYTPDKSWYFPKQTYENGSPTGAEVYIMGLHVQLSFEGSLAYKAATRMPYVTDFSRYPHPIFHSNSVYDLFLPAFVEMTMSAKRLGIFSKDRPHNVNTT